jgi:hypothetical protein
MYVIVLGGMARVGKTEVADMLENLAIESGFFPKRVSFAQPLKEAVAAEHGYGKNWRKFKSDKPELYREQCQTIGAARRAEDPDYWVNLWVERLNKEQGIELRRDDGKENWRETLVIVDDCRYENELKALSLFDGLSVFVAAGERRLDDIDADWRTHESERLAMLSETGGAEGELWDWWLYNDGTPEQLKAKIEERAKYFLGNHPSRFADPCDCEACEAFRCDIQPSELMDALKPLEEKSLSDPTLTDEQRQRVAEAFAKLRDKLESGELSPVDFFSGAWIDILGEAMDDDEDFDIEEDE